MELNNITNTGTWGEQATRLNDNFNKVALGIDTLQSAYQSLSQSAIEAVDTLPQTGEANKIYRLVGTTSYSDYMYNTDDLTTPILMATYNNAIDNTPTANSANLVTSGGVAESLALGAVYDVSANNPTAGSNNDGKWESISALLSDANLNTLIPISVRKGGMSVKFVLSSDNKYVQYRLMSATWSTVATNWQGVDDEPIAESNNLVKSGGVSQFLTQNFLEGKGTTVSTTKITGLIPGHQYRIYLKEYNWGEDIPVSEGFMLFQVSNVYNNVTTYLVRHFKKDEPKEYYDFLIPNNSDYINVDARYTNNQKLHFNIVELNTFTKALRTLKEINSTINTGTYICIPSDGSFNASSILNVYNDGNTIFQTQLIGNISRRRTSSDNGVNWSDWRQGLFEDSDTKRLFTGTNISDSVIDSYKETGIYWGDGCILLVRRISSILIYQWRIFNYSINSKPVFVFRSSSDNGTTWSYWNESIVDFSGDFRYEDINNITDTGFYRSNAVTDQYGFPLLYVRKNNSNITQVRIIISLYNVFSIAIRQSTDNGNTWGDWKDYLQNIQDKIDIINSNEQIISELNINSGEYKKDVVIETATGKWAIGDNGIYLIPVSLFAKLIITANSQKDTLYALLSTNSTVVGETPDYADGYVNYVRIPAGTTAEIVLSNNSNYLYLVEKSGGVNCLPNSIQAVSFSARYEINKLISEISELEGLNTFEQKIVNIQELDKINASIDVNGVWKPTEPNVAGKSSAILCTQIIAKLKIAFASNTSLSFLTELPQSFDTSVAAVFVVGETGRRNYTPGTYIIDIPYGTKYIIISRETSTGSDLSPLEVILYNNNTLVTTQKQVGLKGQIITEDNTIHLENMSNVIPVSDPLSAFASGESNVYHEQETGLVYFTCIEGFEHPYEAYDCVSLYVFSLTNPNRVKRFQIAKASDKSVSRCYTPNLVYLSYKKVRVFYTFQNENGTDGAYLYYKDFNFATETFSTESKVIDSDSNILTASAIQQFTINQGGVDTGKNYVYIQKITDVASDGYRYCTLNCGESTDYNIVVARSNDNFGTIELITITPFRLRYDCAIGVLSDKLYFVFRIGGGEYIASSGTSLCTAEISNGTIINWSTPVKFAEGDSRPDCYTYKDKVYIMAGNYHSVQGRPMRVSSSVWEGVSDNPSDYTKVLVVSDTRGVQNPRVFRYGCGDYGVLMQNSPARVDYPNREATGLLQWQFKTAVCFVCSRIN